MKGNPKSVIPEQMLQDIRTTKNIVLFTHTHPDGDALGSLFGLADILESLGKKVFCCLEEPVSHLYAFLPDIEKGQWELEQYRSFVAKAEQNVMSIALDCGDDDRLGVSKHEFLQVTPFAVIDHHKSHKDFGTVRWVEAGRSSTGEMVYELAIALGAELSYAAAYNLYVAISTDTGSFRYESTKPRTMQIAGELLDKGVKPEEVCRHLYDNFSRERLKLMEMVLSTVTLTTADQLAFMHVSEQMLEESGATMEDVEGFIDFPRSLRSVKVAVLIKETSSGHVAVSMRAKGQCDVAEVAKKFTGGGHRNAAGFRAFGKSIEQIRLELEDVFSTLLLKAS